MKSDGAKLRKRNSREISIKRSLTKITSNWAKCCPSTAVSRNQVPNFSRPSLATIPDDQNSTEEEVDSLPLNAENVSKELSERLDSLEKRFLEFVSQVNIQSSALFDGLKQVKCQLEDAAPVLAQLNHLGKTSNLRVVDILEKTSASNHAKDENEVIAEVKKELFSCKKQLDTLNKSVVKHCLGAKQKELELLKEVKAEVDFLTKDLQLFKSKTNENCEETNAQEIAWLRRHIDSVKQENLRSNRHFSASRKELEVTQKDIFDQMCSLKGNVDAQIQEKSWSGPSDQNKSEIVNADYLQSSNEDKSTRDVRGVSGIENRSASYNKCSLVTDCSADTTQQPSELSSNFGSCQSQLESKSGTYEDVESHCSTGNSRQCRSCVSKSKAVNLIALKKNVLLHDHLLKQLLREAPMKLDRGDFEKSRNYMSGIIDEVIRMKNAYSSTAAGCAVPIMRDVNCISCHMTTNMKIIESSVPRAQPLKFGRDSVTNSLCSHCQNVSNPNWTCNARCNSKRVGGSYTKISRAMQIRQMRFQRLKTPNKRVPSVAVYKSYF